MSLTVRRTLAFQLAKWEVEPLYDPLGYNVWLQLGIVNLEMPLGVEEVTPRIQLVLPVRLQQELS